MNKKNEIKTKKKPKRNSDTTCEIKNNNKKAIYTSANKEISNFAYKTFISKIRKKIIEQPGIQRIDNIGYPFTERDSQYYLSHLSSTKNLNCVNPNNYSNVIITDRHIIRSASTSSILKGTYSKEKAEERRNKKRELDAIIKPCVSRIVQGLSFTHSKHSNDRIFIKNKYGDLFID